jgi:hypothetical protein
MVFLIIHHQKFNEYQRNYRRTFFCRYCAEIFTDRIFFLAKTIGIYRQNVYVSIYWVNPRRNIKNFKKLNSAMTWKFLDIQGTILVVYI